MSPEQPFDEISTADEFEDALCTLLDAATGNGFDPNGSWLYRNGGGAPDWEVQVIELA